MVLEVTRYIKPTIERELWARTAGRCQFKGCNTLLYKSAVTQESVNLAEKAHIYSFSKDGPRGWGPFKTGLNKLNDISNLMLLCHGCHKKIDQEGGELRYPSKLLISWKKDHELRIETVTGITPENKSHVVLYGASIGSEKSPIHYHACVEAMFPDRFPANERPIIASMKSALKDSSPEFWLAESTHLISTFNQRILPIIEEDQCKHFSVFSLAPQPLLILLGSLLTDKIDVETYQLHREPKSWCWQESEDDDFDYIIRRPERFDGAPTLILSLSDHVAHERLEKPIGNNLSIWEITVKHPNNDFMQAKEQLVKFRKRLRRLIVEIKHKHGESTPLNIVPVMPVSCAVELGRTRMPKADMPWLIYDQDIKAQEFVKAIELKGDLHAK